MSLLRTVEQLVERLENADRLDAPSEKLAGILQRALAAPRVRDALSGTTIGHPVHPVLVALPIGSWTAATYLDLTGGNQQAAKRLVAFGILSAVPTALTGANDWMTTTGAERRVGVVHGLLNSGAMLLYTGSWLARRRGRRARGVGMALAGASAISGAGWLGGHLVYAMGIGVDTTSFQELTREWTDIAAESDVSEGAALMRDLGGVPVLVTRSEGRVLAMYDRCTHRGGPLHEGDISAGCVRCPWHGSVFRLDDGTVVDGPATRPQPLVEVRTVDGRLQVRRRSEVRSLRTNPVGV